MQTHLERIKKDLEVLATYTSTPGFGVTRSSYSKEDKQAREYLIREMEKLNLKIYEDGISTLFVQNGSFSLLTLPLSMLLTSSLNF